jgi:hypothetical protein
LDGFGVRNGFDGIELQQLGGAFLLANPSVGDSRNAAIASPAQQRVRFLALISLMVFIMIFR